MGIVQMQRLEPDYETFSKCHQPSMKENMGENAESLLKRVNKSELHKN